MNNSFSFICLQLLLGFIIADIISGLFHWFEDTYLDYCINLPIIGEISKDNELHHYFPRSVFAHSYFETITVSLSLTLILILFIYFLNKKLVLKYTYVFISFGFFSSVSSLIHRFSHLRDCENYQVIHFLQKFGILCSHEHHSLHHDLVNQKYCAITEYNNYILDSIHFWRGLENVIFFFTNIKPKRKLTYNEYSKIHTHMHANAKLECPNTPSKQDVEELMEKLKQYKNCDNKVPDLERAGSTVILQTPSTTSTEFSRSPAALLRLASHSGSLH